MKGYKWKRTSKPEVYSLYHNKTKQVVGLARCDGRRKWEARRFPSGVVHVLPLRSRLECAEWILERGEFKP